MIALTTTSIAWIILAAIVIGWFAYAISNLRSGKVEAGSELELAANRKPYLDDSELEGRHLELVQLLGVVLLIVVVIGLPLYWVFEPARQSGATEGAENRLAGWGGDLFDTTANGGFNCAGCHGGMNGTGGAADYSITDSKTQEVKAVVWTAPAVNTVFYRYSEDEVRFILVYGRPFSPMSAWGIDGGGPMNSQQIDSLIAYLKSIQLEPADCAEGETPVDIDVGRIIEDEVVTICPSGQLPAEKREEIENAARQSVDDGTYASYGEALFNLELDSGAFSCARCHTQGWSYDDPGVPGQGAFGWNLRGGATNSHFPNQADMVDFIAAGSEIGAVYGIQGQGSGRMPGFGAMLTDEQIEEVVEYVRGL